MKKVFKSTLAFVLGFLCFSASAQIIKEHTYGPTQGLTLEPYRLSSGKVIYAAFSYRDNQIKIYNTDHSLYKTLNVPIVQGLNFRSILYLSDKLFDLNAELEYVALYINFSAETNSSTYFGAIYTESGQELIKLPGADVVYVYDTPEGTKLHSLSFPNQTTQYDIYSLPGQVPLSASLEVEATQRVMPYPNPATTHIIHLPYQLSPGEQGELVIYDTRGAIMKSYRVDSTFNHLRIDTSQFPKGTFIYKVNRNGKGGSSAKFIVQ